MKILKTLATGIAFLFFVSMPAHAEFRLGLEAGYGKSTAESKGDLTDGDDDDSASNFGLIGQWRAAAQPSGVSWGVHLGYGSDNSEYEGSYFGVAALPVPGTFTFNFKGEQGATFDLLGLVAWNSGGLRPYIMAGYSTVDAEFEMSATGSGFNNAAFNTTIDDDNEKTLTGYKLVAGFEGDAGVNSNWVWNVGLTYANYGDEEFSFTGGGLVAKEKVELDKTTVQFGIQYRF